MYTFLRFCKHSTPIETCVDRKGDYAIKHYRCAKCGGDPQTLIYFGKELVYKVPKRYGPYQEANKS